MLNLLSSGVVDPTYILMINLSEGWETGIYYYGARYYNPEIRRFVQPDPIIQDVYDPQALNRYSYTLNNPVKYIDPSGHMALIFIPDNPINQWFRENVAPHVVRLIEDISFAPFYNLRMAAECGMKCYEEPNIEDCSKAFVAGYSFGMITGIESPGRVPPKGVKGINDATTVRGVKSFGKKVEEMRRSVHRYKHLKATQWSKKVVGSTKHGNALYKPGVDVISLEQKALREGTAYTKGGHNYVILDTGEVIGASKGVETTKVLVDIEDVFYHSRPIAETEDLYKSLIKNK